MTKPENEQWFTSSGASSQWWNVQYSVPTYWDHAMAFRQGLGKKIQTGQRKLTKLKGAVIILLLVVPGVQWSEGALGVASCNAILGLAPVVFWKTTGVSAKHQVG